MKEAMDAHEAITAYRNGDNSHWCQEAIDLYEAWLEYIGDERRSHVVAVLQFLGVDLSVYAGKEVTMNRSDSLRQKLSTVFSEYGPRVHSAAEEAERRLTELEQRDRARQQRHDGSARQRTPALHTDQEA